MRIGIDIDGVLTNIEQWQLDVGSKFFAKYNKKIVNRQGYDITDIFDVSKELEDEFWDKYFYKYITTSPARKFAGEVIKFLKDNGNEIYIITARYLNEKSEENYKKMKKIISSWLEQEKIIYDKIIFSPEDKLEVCLENNIDLMIEDKPENIEKISTKLPVISFYAEYNKNCKNNNIHRAYTWYDVYNLLIEIF